MKRRRIEKNVCPCGGGQSCIVDRRSLNDWVHEDDVFKEAGLPIRKNCLSSYTKEQQKILDNDLNGEFKSITYRWTEDSY